MLLRSTAKSITDKSRRIISENWFLCMMGISLTLIRQSVVHLLPEHGAWSCSSTWSSDQCLPRRWGLARTKPACPASSRHRESRCGSVCIWSQLFSLFFPPTLPLGWEVLILPILSMVSGHYYPTGRKPTSTLPTDICPTGREVSSTKPETGRHPVHNSFNCVLLLLLLCAMEKAVPAKHIKIL